MPLPLLDSHIHLWPSTATSPTDHTWMTSPSHPLATRHSLTEYLSSTSSSPVPPSAAIYVETDRHLPSPSPPASLLTPSLPRSAVVRELRTWARAPLEELAFLRRVVEGKPEEGDGVEEAGQGQVLRGLVIWAPFSTPPAVFECYLEIAREVLGEEAWGRVVGWRFLMQGRGREEVGGLVLGEDEDGWFVGNVRRACEGGRTFDVGVDAHRDGVEVLEVVGGFVARLEGVGVVLDHLLKPSLSLPPSSPWPSHPTWSTHLAHLSTHPTTSLKLSGLLNEFSPGPCPSSPADILAAARPYLDHALACFGAKRLMFGSDWPVCNVGGPRGKGGGEEGKGGNWGLWREVVEGWMEDRGMGEGDRREIWGGAAARAYGVGNWGVE